MAEVLTGVPYCTDPECCDPEERSAFIRDQGWLDPNTVEWAGRCVVCLRPKANHSIHCKEYA